MPILEASVSWRWTGREGKCGCPFRNFPPEATIEWPSDKEEEGKGGSGPEDPGDAHVEGQIENASYAASTPE